MVHRTTVSFGLVFVALLASPTTPCASGQEKTGVAKWEYKAVAFGADEKANTRKLNDLAADGWEYVGPLGNGMVAFRRRPVAGDLRITVLGGNQVKAEAFYLLEGEKNSRTYAELIGRLKEERRKGSARRVMLRLTATSPARESPVVERLVHWLRENGVEVRISVQD